MNSFSPSIPQFAGGKLTQALQQILRDLWEILILKNFSKSFFKFAWHNQIFKFKSIVISWVQLFSIVSYFKYGKSWFSNLWLLPKTFSGVHNNWPILKNLVLNCCTPNFQVYWQHNTNIQTRLCNLTYFLSIKHFNVLSYYAANYIRNG